MSGCCSYNCYDATFVSLKRDSVDYNRMYYNI